MILTGGKTKTAIIAFSIIKIITHSTKPASDYWNMFYQVHSQVKIHIVGRMIPYIQVFLHHNP